MTKKIMLIAISALFAGGIAFAAEPSTNNAQCSAANGKECDKVCTDNQPGVVGKKYDRPDLFEGITLTAEQQARLDAIRQECSARGNKAKKDVKSAGERSREWLGKVKEVLTAEQYVTFLENSFVSRGNRNIRQPRMAQLKGRGKKLNGQPYCKGNAGTYCTAPATTASN